MTDFSTKLYINNIQIKHLYSYDKQQIKLFLSKRFLRDKLNYKITSNMSSQIGLIHLFCCPYYHNTASYRIFIFCCPLFTRVIQTSNQLLQLNAVKPTILNYYTVKTSPAPLKEICSSFYVTNKSKVSRYLDC